MSEPENSFVNQSVKLEDTSHDLVGSKVLKTLDKYGLLNDMDKLMKTSISQLLHWGFGLETITKCKAMAGSENVKFETAAAFFERKEKFQQIKFNDSSLDALTGGGIDVGSVTEIYGEAGSGKTQLCLHLALNCVLPSELNGLGGEVVYISTDKAFPATRLAEITLSMEETLRTPLMNLLDKIFVAKLSSPAELHNFLEKILPALLHVSAETRLVVIDSIAGIFRNETNYIKRASEMRWVMNQLEQLADIYNFAILITNHITAVTISGKNVPCLGVAWDNLVTTKIEIRRAPAVDGCKTFRTMEVKYSPRVVCGMAQFSIEPSGIVGIQ